MPVKKYRQPKNGHKIHNSDTLFLNNKDMINRKSPANSDRKVIASEREV